ncbi:unnamed protein product [Larinioides sclopetarius]
MNQAKIT